GLRAYDHAERPVRRLIDAEDQGPRIHRSRLGCRDDGARRRRRGERGGAREVARGPPGDGEERLLEGEGLAQRFPRAHSGETARDAERIGDGRLVSVGTLRPVEVTSLPRGVSPEGTDDEAVAANGPGRDASVEDRRLRSAPELRDQELVRRLERELAGPLRL